MKKATLTFLSIATLTSGASATLTFAPIDITIGSGSTATQSTDFNASLTADLALDGNTGNFTHTASGDTAPTWTGNFNRTETFNQVVLHNRDSCCQDRFSNVTVQVLDGGGGVLFTSGVLNAGNSLGSPPSITVNLPSAISGNQIRVTRDPSNTIGGGNFLSIGEVQIGQINDVFLPLGTNLTQASIIGMSVAQSPTSASPPGNGFASNAVDGNLGNFTHTNANVNVDHTWQVDFGEEMLIENVSLFNRSGCCGERLRDITISVLDGGGSTVFSSGTLNPGNSLGFSGTNQGGLAFDFTTLNGGNPVQGQTVLVTRTPDAVGPNLDDRSVLALGEVTVIGGSVVPEPTSALLAGLAAFGLALRRRRA